MLGRSLPKPGMPEPSVCDVYLTIEIFDDVAAPGP
jgi:hypothetical protein